MKKLFFILILTVIIFSAYETKAAGLTTYQQTNYNFSSNEIFGAPVGGEIFQLIGSISEWLPGTYNFYAEVKMKIITLGGGGMKLYLFGVRNDSTNCVMLGAKNITDIVEGEVKSYSVVFENVTLNNTLCGGAIDHLKLLISSGLPYSRYTVFGSNLASSFTLPSGYDYASQAENLSDLYFKVGDNDVFFGQYVVSIVSPLNNQFFSNPLVLLSANATATELSHLIFRVKHAVTGKQIFRWDTPYFDGSVNFQNTVGLPNGKWKFEVELWRADYAELKQKVSALFEVQVPESPLGPYDFIPPPDFPDQTIESPVVPLYIQELDCSQSDWWNILPCNLANYAVKIANKIINVGLNSAKFVYEKTNAFVFSVFPFNIIRSVNTIIQEAYVSTDEPPIVISGISVFPAMSFTVWSPQTVAWANQTLGFDYRDFGDYILWGIAGLVMLFGAIDTIAGIFRAHRGDDYSGLNFKRK